MCTLCIFTFWLKPQNRLENAYLSWLQNFAVQPHCNHTASSIASSYFFSVALIALLVHSDVYFLLALHVWVVTVGWEVSR